jgi:DNA topoisomerase-1
MGPKKTFKLNKANKAKDYLFEKGDADYLLIVESPSKCKKIEEYLGSQYKCIASKGHIRSIDGLHSIDTKKTFEPTFTWIEKKKGHIQIMTTIIEEFPNTNILLATDDDREGEAIAWHICQVFGLSIVDTPRIIFHEITQPAILKAIENPTRINMDLVHAQHARQVLDIIVGYKISPYLWKGISKDTSDVLSAGRCQTPALRLVYDNDLKITKNGGSEGNKKYKIEGIFCPPKNIIFQLDKEIDTEEQVAEFMEKTRTFSHSIRKVTDGPREITRAPPSPFHTSRLLQSASNILHLSPTMTMSLCQTLYQNGYITYMRTESSHYTPLFLNKVVEYITNKMGLSEKYIGDHSKIVNTNSQNPHEAIRVTNIGLQRIESENKALEKLYHFIWKHTLESCMAPATSILTDYRVSSPIPTVEYIHTIEIPKFKGWKIVAPLKEDDEGSSTTTDLKSGEQFYLDSIISAKVASLPYKRIDAHLVLHKQHSRYTEAGLIQTLEEYGIGHPSTFSSIVDTILERGYVKKEDIEGEHIICNEYSYEWGQKDIQVLQKERVLGGEKGKLVIQPLGKQTLEFLLKHFQPLFSYEYTKNMEKELDETKDMNICKTCYQDIKTMSKSLVAEMKEKVIFEKGGETYQIGYEKYGPILKRKIGSSSPVSRDDVGKENEWEYIPLKKDFVIDMETMRTEAFTSNLNMEDIIQVVEREIGSYMGSPITVKRGRYGTYIEWFDTIEKKERHENVDTKKHIEELQISDIENLLVKKQETENNILRRLGPNMSIRRGKYGSYIYYKTETDQKPQFIPLKKFKGDYMECQINTIEEWVRDYTPPKKYNGKK